MTIDAMGNGTLTLGGTSTGNISLARATQVTGILGAASSTHEHFLSLDADWVSTQDPRDVNVLAIQHKNASGISAIRFLDNNWTLSNNSEKGAVGYGNINDGSPYARAQFVGSSDLTGVAPYSPTTLVPIRLIQYGRVSGVNGDYGVLDLDSSGNLNIWHGVWGSKSLSLFIDQSGRVGVGTNTFISTEKVSFAGTAPIRFFTDATSASLNVTGTEQLISGFKDSTPTKAVSIGTNNIGGGPGQDIVFNTYNGSAWAEKMRILNGGNVGIGIVAPNFAFSVVKSAASANAFALTNTNTTADTLTSVLRLNIGTATTDTNARFLEFYGGSTTDNNGTRMGRIQLNNTGVAYNTGNADFAEYFDVYQHVEPGDVIAISELGNGKSTTNGKLLGVVSDSAGFIGNAKIDKPDATHAVVGISGQIKTKVSAENGPIKKGDYLTSSSISGVAVKATKPGEVIGEALDNFTSDNPQAVGKIMVMVNIGFADPEGVLSKLLPSNNSANSPLSSSSLLDLATQALQAKLQSMGVAIQNGILQVKEIMADKVTGNILCAGSACVNQEQLQQLLQDHQQLQEFLQKEAVNK